MTILKFFQKAEEEGTLPNSFYKARNARQRHYKKRKLQANIPDKDRCKNPQQNNSKPNSTES